MIVETFSDHANKLYARMSKDFLVTLEDKPKLKYFSVCLAFKEERLLDWFKMEYLSCFYTDNVEREESNIVCKKLAELAYSIFPKHLGVIEVCPKCNCVKLLKSNKEPTKRKCTKCNEIFEIKKEERSEKDGKKIQTDKIDGIPEGSEGNKLSSDGKVKTKRKRV